MKKILAVYDSDVNYVTRFMEYFKNDKDFEFEICAFTKKDNLVAYLCAHKIEILVYGKDLELENLPPASFKYLCQLLEERQTDSESPAIYKYQPARLLMEELLSGYARSLEIARDTLNAKQRIITVYSISPKSEAYAFAASIAVQYSKQRRTLFIPLELLPISNISFIDSSKQALSEFIYYLKENQNIVPKLKELLCYNINLAYLSGISHAFDLLSLSKEDISRLITELQHNTDFETIIFYLSFYNETAIELLQLSDTVILPVNDTSYENTLVKEWEEQMERIEISTETDKYMKVLFNQDAMAKNSYVTLMELSESPIWEEATKYL